ncbi:MAG TPA: DNA cytosine methyltransferase [Phycisphaerae bacterium]|nr:DNA cytosine methyltransferase [Phycisphaerae bacterium]
MADIRAVDLFCGAGGSSWGARAAGAEIVAGFDMWGLAGKVYKDNFPQATFHEGKLEELDLDNVVEGLGEINLILASPECTNHSPAKGDLPRCEKSRATAFQVIRFAQALQPRWIVVENVVSMRNWKRYGAFLKGLKQLGYNVSPQVLNAADFGVAQKRRRLFILCDSEQEPPSVEPTARKWKTASLVVSQNGEYVYSPLRTQRRATATIERAERAIAALGNQEPFLIVYYGSDGAGGWQSLDVPLRTLTTLDRFAHVKPMESGHVMRMLQVPELKAAMGMPKRFRLAHGTRRMRVRMVGNAVCPPVMQAAIEAVQANAHTR